MPNLVVSHTVRTHIESPRILGTLAIAPWADPEAVTRGVRMHGIWGMENPQRGPGAEPRKHLSSSIYEEPKRNPNPYVYRTRTEHEPDIMGSFLSPVSVSTRSNNGYNSDRGPSALRMTVARKLRGCTRAAFVSVIPNIWNGTVW